MRAAALRSRERVDAIPSQRCANRLAIFVLPSAQSVGPDNRFVHGFPISSLLGAGVLRKAGGGGVAFRALPIVDHGLALSVHPLKKGIRSHMTRHVRSWAIAALAAFALAGTAAPSFAEVVYNVTNYAEGQNGWSVNGTITVVGVGTYTDASAITAWDITLSKPSTGSYQFTNALAGHDVITLDAPLIASTGALGLSAGEGLVFRSLDNANALRWLPNYVTYQVFYNNGLAFEILYNSNNDVWTIGTAQAVPEPSTYCMALAGLACGGYSMFRRRKRA